jgi:squalene-hopene/tetraprenyl-beta-curcumene cyclase
MSSSAAPLADGLDVDRAVDGLVDVLLRRRTAIDHWEGRLASSALSTATAVLALHLTQTHRHSADDLQRFVTAGTRWLTEHQNRDGGWGDTVRSRTNISTTAIVWATLSASAGGDPRAEAAVTRATGWLERAAGDVSPARLRAAILRRYGKDQTFSVPILTVLALAGKLGADTRKGWRSVPQLPFELAALPHRWFQHLSLPVVSYALPALIAIGQVRHAHAPTRNPAARVLRQIVRNRTHSVLHEMQPESGGYLEATPLTSFVVMSLAGMGRVDSPVVRSGARFLAGSMRPDGSWPIDTNLATWVTTLSVGALTDCGVVGAQDRTAAQHREAVRTWLLDQQTAREHPFTHAAPGAWAWTPLSGGVPDADDTSGALIALHHLQCGDAPGPRELSAAAAGARWLLGLQNRDGGVPTFCRGWGALPFDKSTPEITAHALRAWSAWHPRFDSRLQADLLAASSRAVRYLVDSQQPDGSWVPLWFGNEHAPGEANPAYGTARTLVGLQSALAGREAAVGRSRQSAVDWLLTVQNADGGWGGDAGIASTIEETGVVLSALAGELSSQASPRLHEAAARGASWLSAAVTNQDLSAAPIGLYFARLWYYEELYPLIFALSGLGALRAARRRMAADAVTAS